MPCTIADVLQVLNPDGSLSPVAGAPVIATPSVTPLFVVKSGVLTPLQEPGPIAQSNQLGTYSLLLPWQSECDPATVTWEITLPDGTVWGGAVPAGLAGPFTIEQLKTSHGWGLVAGGGSNPINTVSGPAGAAGAAGPTLNWRAAWSSTTPYATNDAVSYAGSSYLAVAGSTGVTPGTDPTKWNTIALGATGATGPTESGTSCQFEVTDTHIYQTTGTHTVHVHIVDEGGSSVDVTTTILVGIPASTSGASATVVQFPQECGTASSIRYSGSSSSNTGSLYYYHYNPGILITSLQVISVGVDSNGNGFAYGTALENGKPVTVYISVQPEPYPVPCSGTFQIRATNGTTLYDSGVVNVEYATVSGAPSSGGFVPLGGNTTPKVTVPTPTATPKPTPTSTTGTGNTGGGTFHRFGTSWFSGSLLCQLRNQYRGSSCP